MGVCLARITQSLAPFAYLFGLRKEAAGERRPPILVLATSQMSSAPKIDALILSHTMDRWRKVAFVIATVLIEGGDDFADVDDSFVAQRVKYLVKEGRIESRGDPNQMRYSEIRLAQR